MDTSEKPIVLDNDKMVYGVAGLMAICSTEGLLNPHKLAAQYLCFMGFGEVGVVRKYGPFVDGWGSTIEALGMCKLDNATDTR